MFREGVAQIATINATHPKTTTRIERSCSVRAALARVCAAAAPKSDNPARIPRQINGNDVSRLMIPPAATAPAPMYKM
jgi:hypothetical protein